MNRRLILLNLALIGLAVALAWTLRQHWLEARAREQAELDRASAARSYVAQPPAVIPPKPAPAAEFVDVAQHDLFSKDRNPNIVVETPPPPPPPPPMPALPFYYGQMSIGEPSILLGSSNATQKRYHAGEKIDAFEIVKFDQERVQFKWTDKIVERKLSELMPKDETPVAAVAAVNPTQAPAGPSPSQVATKTFGAAPEAASTTKLDAKIGEDRGGGFRTCVMGETSPAGTVVDGYRKVITRVLMGTTCFWEPVNQ